MLAATRSTILKGKSLAEHRRSEAANSPEIRNALARPGLETEDREAEEWPKSTNSLVGFGQYFGRGHCRDTETQRARVRKARPTELNHRRFSAVVRVAGS